MLAYVVFWLYVKISIFNEDIWENGLLIKKKKYEKAIFCLYSNNVCYID